MKVDGSYASLVQGVSQQPPEKRLDGQMTEQVNMLPDVVEGLTRRHGSVWQAEYDTDTDPDQLTSQIADLRSYRCFPYTNGGKDFILCIRRKAKAVGTDLPPIFCYNKTDQSFHTYTRNTVDADLDEFEAGGCSAVTAIGKYVFMAGNTIVPSATSTDLWGDVTNRLDAVLWVRGGAYGRTFKVTATKDDDSTVDFEYTTPVSSYPGVLDTSHVPLYTITGPGPTATNESPFLPTPTVGSIITYRLHFAEHTVTALLVGRNGVFLTNTFPTPPASASEYSWDSGAPDTVDFHSSNALSENINIAYSTVALATNPSYADQVNDITNAYNTAVTNWIGSAAEAIQPDNIAESLRLAAVAAGLSSALRDGSTVIFDNIKALQVEDGGDNTLLRGVANEVTTVDKLSDKHKVGKIVRIRAKNASENFYMRAQAKEATVTSGYTEVRWIEGAGTEHAVTLAVIYGVVDGTNFDVASSAAGLATLSGFTDVPEYAVSTAGDADSAALPFFIGKTITYLGVFQDRLLVGAGAVIRASKTTDYLNFFRSSILTVPADDPFEVLSQGNEDDILRHSVFYDRDLVLFGDLRQYVLNGRATMSPTNAAMPIMSAHANATAAPPLAVGELIFYGQTTTTISGKATSSLHQIQPGQVAESPESYINSSQLKNYMRGTVIEIARHDNPTHIFVRTTENDNGFYVFSYLTQEGQGRIQAAWSRFVYADEIGQIAGISPDPNGLFVFSFRQALNADGDAFINWLTVDRQPLTTGLSSYPYLDSIRTIDQVEDADSVNPNTTGAWYAAFDDSTDRFLIGSPLADYLQLEADFPDGDGLLVGALTESYVIPTNPRAKDGNGQTINTGKLTVSSFLLSLKDSSGLVTSLTRRKGTPIVRTYNGRVIGDPDNLIGHEPVTDLSQSVPIATERKKFELKLSARKWMPLTISTIEWIGQLFHRPQRVG